MTSIAGIFQTNGAPLDRKLLSLIATAPAYDRGDPIRVWESERLGFSQVDSNRSIRQRQPLVDPASGCVIVFEGRLDNRAELSDALGPNRPPIDNETDAAFVLAGYLRWGKECVTHLIGDFVFAIWDPKGHQLFLARDPLGQRPLYYAHTGGRFVFASTLEQLLQEGALPHELDDEILPWYVYAYGALREETLYRGIKSLPGGCTLIVDEKQCAIERYWQWQEAPPEARVLTENDTDEFRVLFAEAVRCRLRGDEPVGLLLSGGLDSGSIASMAGYLQAQSGSPPVYTYSFVFDKFAECDERAYIDPIVSRYGMPHTPVPVDDCWTLSRLDPWRSVFSEPFFAPYDAMFYKTLTQAQADGMRVMLMGHGGDLLLDGSPRYLADWLLAGRWREVHRQTRAYASAAGRPYAVGLIGNAVSPLFPTWARRRIEFRHMPRIKALVPKHLRAFGFDAIPHVHRGGNAWWYDLRERLIIGQTPHEGYLDRLMRLFGMQVRQPFLDVRLIKFILDLPPDATYSNGTHRTILRQGLADILPASVQARRSKTSFAPLMRHGLQARSKFVHALLQDSELARRGVVVERVWQRAIEESLRTEQLLSIVYWNSLVTEIWLRIQSGRLPELD